MSIMMKCSEKTPSSSSTRWPIMATVALCISKTHSCLFHLHKTTERLSCYPATHTVTHTAAISASVHFLSSMNYEKGKMEHQTHSACTQRFTHLTHRHTNVTRLNFYTPRLLFPGCHTFMQHTHNIYIHVFFTITKCSNVLHSLGI